MQLACTHCGQTLEFSGKRPSFCAYCGKSLSDSGARPGSTIEFDHEAATRAPGAADTVEVSDDPAEVGGYRLLRVLGEGGMGKVYEAEDAATGRRVALKLIAAQYAGSPEAVERFRREGRLASALSHPRCVFVLAADEQAGRPYIVMELMPGRTLEDLVRERGPLPVEQALPKILDVIEGLKEAHRLGVIHRDVKPPNCFLEPDGRVKVGDFGLAKSLVQGAHLTKTGSFLGTPLFASPEQIKGETTGPQADVYSVAATLYYLLTGRAPFQGGDPAATLARIVCDPPPPLRSLRPDLPEALDRAVLRGLERDRERRWRDLDSFEAALRPFLPGRLSLAGLGVRFGAYLIDYFLLMLLASGITLPLALVRGDFAALAENRLKTQVEYQALGLLLWLVYFAVPESLWGWSPGKRFLGLRVTRASGAELPGPGRALLRAGAFSTLLNLGSIGLWVLMFLGVVDLESKDPFVQIKQSMIVLGTVYPLLAAGIALMVCPMRARNGYRGLHEWASDTRVIRLPEAGRRRTLGARCAGLTVHYPEGLPERLGSFGVSGAVRTGRRDALLLGEDHALGRKVFLWLRPADGGVPVSPERRQLSRPTRPRWLAGGHRGDQLWDAFLLPEGHPLPDVVASDGRLGWADTRYLLTQLTEELAAGKDDGTRPASLAVDQVWVQSAGQVQLLDVPLLGEVPSGHALDLLADVAVLALEGRPRLPGAPLAPVRAPLPQHAAHLLDRLIGCAKPYRRLRDFQADLAETADNPAAVTRGRRLAHVAVMTAFLSIGLCAGLAPLGMLSVMPAFGETFALEADAGIQGPLDGLLARDAVAALQGDPFSRYVALRQSQDDGRLREQVHEALTQRRRVLDARRRSLSWIGQGYTALVEKQSGQMSEQLRSVRSNQFSRPEMVRAVARGISNRADEFAGQHFFQMAAVFIGAFLFWPVVWIVWAFLWRGGLSFRMLGLALVRADGRPAGRLQCAWRAFLFWAPVAAMVILAVWLDASYWSQWTPDSPPSWLPWLAALTWWAGLALFPAYLILALRTPERSLHDRLAGTYLVPR